jgi:hypothetical protein
MEQKLRRQIEAAITLAGTDNEVLLMETERAGWAREIAERHLEMASWLQGWLDLEDERRQTAE